MGCSSCSTDTTTTGGSPGGCQNNGTCGTSGCNKLNVYNWLSDMVLPLGYKPFDVVEVRFKGSRKEFFRNIHNLDLKTGDMVAVEGSPGHDIGEISLSGELVRFQLRKKGVRDDAPEIKALYRLARPADIEKYREVKTAEEKTMHRSRTIALALGLKMKLSDVEYQGDGKKATFFYTADERVDFRELIKKLADEFKVRIEMRQIGMRQEAARLGGIGSCGRELCCSTWLTEFKVVSTSAARYQNLSLNPIKLAGQCGKLKCCLNYELDAYLDALKDIPDTSTKLLTAKGTMLHRKTDIFKKILWYALIPDVKEGEDRPFTGPESWIPLAASRAKEIIELNKQNVRPEDAGRLEIEEEEEELGYDDVVGQDSLTRMDRAKKKKKKKKPSGDKSLPAAGAAPQIQGQRPAQQQRPQQNQQRGPQQGGQPKSGGQQGQNPQQPKPQHPPRQKPGGDNSNPATGGNAPDKQRQQQARPPQQPRPQQQQQGPRPQQPNPRPQQQPQQQQPRPQQQQQQRTDKPNPTVQPQQNPDQAKPVIPIAQPDGQPRGNRPERRRPGDQPTNG